MLPRKLVATFTNCATPALFSDRQFRRSLEQIAGIGMDGISGDQVGISEFDDLSFIHDRDSGREIADHRHGVRDKEVGQAEVALKLGEKVDDLSSDADVEG